MAPAASDPSLSRFGREIVAALEDVGFPAFVTDRQGRVQWQNAASVEFQGDQRGRLMTSLVAPVDRHAVRERITRKLLGIDIATEATVRLRNRKGELVRVDVSTVSLIDEQGQVIGIFGVEHPIAPADIKLPERNLTPREQQVLRLLVLGRSTEQMAEAMGVTPATVRNHVKRLLRALGVHSRIEAVALARRESLVVN
jgi:PAS domain S-box-containing protein